MDDVGLPDGRCPDHRTNVDGVFAAGDVIDPTTARR